MQLAGKRPGVWEPFRECFFNVASEKAGMEKKESSHPCPKTASILFVNSYNKKERMK
jgi:hypothetical protein